jgi:hypothetical protein
LNTSENTPEEPKEITFPEFVARAGGQRGMQNELDFSAGREPLRDGERRIFDGRKTHGKRLQTAKSKAAVVG